jgi:membrane-associated phospholipid phosphatase
VVKDPRLSQRTVRILIAVVVVAVGAAALVLNLPGKSAKSAPLGGQPLPALFPDARLSAVHGVITRADRRARKDAAVWLRAHPVRDDAGFASFALRHVGPPPSGAVQRRELAALHRIDANRTPAGTKAAFWLEAHGKKDIWALYLKQYRQLVAKPAGTVAKRRFKATNTLAKGLAQRGKERFARPSPYIVDPSLHGLNQKRFSKKFSYPAKHAVLAAALGAVLAHYEPHRSGEYRWMQEQVAYSRLYAGGHYPSDLAAGTYLGRLAAQYELALPPGR